jgi:5-methyltetrahydropteroyltriglutamate--homocysteine methyltransferase
MPSPLLTASVGSYPQPDWLVDRARLAQLMAPRVRATEIWRVAPQHLAQACDDATLVAIREQELAGLDIITDGEIRRESYSNRFATALGGVDRERHGEIVGRTGRTVPVPLVTGPIEWTEPIGARDIEFLRARTERTIKATLPGPFTLSLQAVDRHYGDDAALALAYADAVNLEIRALFAAGADVVQLDEPWLETRPDAAKRYGVAAINRAMAGAAGTTALHVCFGYAALVKDKPAAYAALEALGGAAVDQISIEAAQPKLDLGVLAGLPEKTWMIGVIDLADPGVETPAVVAARIRRALEVVPPERLIVTPDCGMKYLPRPTAFGKLEALSAGAALVRRELG